MLYTFTAHDRNNTNFSVDPPISGFVPPPDLYSGDRFTYSENKTHIVDSPLRNHKGIPGILRLRDNKTYGRTPNNRRFYYQCIPHDPSWPIFLVPYDPPQQSEFVKVQTNSFVLFRFVSTPALGELTQVLGPTNNLEAQYAYEWHVQGLQRPPRNIQTNQPVIPPGEYTRNNTRFITIDSEGTQCRDDAIGAEVQPDGSVDVFVAITYVPGWISPIYDTITFPLASVIYAPHRRIPMLPPSLEEKASLNHKTSQFVLVAKWNVVDGHSPIAYWSLQKIDIDACYSYDDPYLEKDATFRLVSQTLKITDPHALIQNLMESYNLAAATYCTHFQQQAPAWYCTSDCIPSGENPTSSELPPEIQRYRARLSLAKEQHVKYTVIPTEYLTVTSPLRRLPDLYNQYMMARALNLGTLTRLPAFPDLETVMENLRRIRRYENHTWLRTLCFKDPTPHAYECWIVACHPCRGGKSYETTIYCRELKWTTTVITAQWLTPWTCHTFRKWVMEDKDKIHDQVKLEWIELHEY